jgi:hypothetical protein
MEDAHSVGSLQGKKRDGVPVPPAFIKTATPPGDFREAAEQHQVVPFGAFAGFRCLGSAPRLPMRMTLLIDAKPFPFWKRYFFSITYSADARILYSA